MWHIPELFIHIVLHLHEDDLAHCYHVSHHWRQTLRNNLPPQSRPLPDTLTRQEYTPLSNEIRTLAADIESQQRQWTSLAVLIELGDDYFFWRDGILEAMLQHVKPHLHPFLASSAHALISGLASVAEGNMGIWLQTLCNKEDLLRCSDSVGVAYLTNPPTSSVEIYCPKGAVWDDTNKSVRRRGGPTWRYNFVRVERKGGVLMNDVLDELRGVLVPEEGEGKVLLDWQFDTEDGDA